MRINKYFIFSLILFFIMLIVLFYIFIFNGKNGIKVYKKKHIIENKISMSQIENCLDYFLENGITSKSSQCINPINSEKYFLSSLCFDDIDYLFKKLEKEYAGFEHFGGRVLFKDIFNRIKLRMSNPGITYLQFIIILYEELSLIKDTHFTIDQYFVTDFYSIYYDNRYKVSIENDEAFFKNNENNLHIVSINEKSINENIKYFINLEKGLIKTIYDILENCSYVQTATLQHDNKSSSTLLIKKINSVRHREYGYQIDIYSNTCILKIYDFNINNYLDEKLNTFIETANLIKKSNNIIIDLRGNHGGSTSQIDSWLKEYFEKVLPAPFLTFKKNNINEFEITELGITFNYLELKKNTEKKKYIVRELCNYFNDLYKLCLSVYNDKPIYIFIDNGTVSSAEYLLTFLKFYCNVITIGTNTGGMFAISDNMTYTLPNTKIKISFGNKYIFNPIFNIKEGRGIIPDYLFEDNTDEEIYQKVIELIPTFRK